MTITNGANHHNTVEDLLSSIRTSIADDSGNVRQGPSSPLTGQHNGQHSTMNGAMNRRNAAADEHAEFELPAIFKPGHHNNHSDKPNNLFGRLSDALKPAQNAEHERSRTVIRFEPAGGRMIEPPAPSFAAHVVTNQAARSEPPVDPVEKVASENAPVRREMPSFFDARLNRMGEMTRQANTPQPVEPPPAPPQPVQQVQVVAPQPPPLRPQPQPPAADASAGGLEDAAAQLLRPILKQWLTDNMPKIVEKALRSEAGDDYPPVGTPPDRRK